MQLHYYKTDILYTLSTSRSDVLICLVVDYLTRMVRKETRTVWGHEGGTGG